jgi:hypothetical protein
MKNALQNSEVNQSALELFKKQIVDLFGFEIVNLKLNSESKEYSACSFTLNGKSIQFRVSKITPTKTGQFVTIWKRNNEGITEPYDSSDQLDLIIIYSESGEKAGYFLFPIAVLIEKGIISHKNKQGKRGIRVYPPWDIAVNKQAQKTQSWQTNYFVSNDKNDGIGIELLKNLMN